MNDMKHIAASGAIVNSALYLALVGAAGIAADAHIVVTLAALAAGVAFMSYNLMYAIPSSKAATWFASVSWGLGVMAGVELLFKYFR